MHSQFVVFLDVSCTKRDLENIYLPQNKLSGSSKAGFPIKRQLMKLPCSVGACTSHDQHQLQTWTLRRLTVLQTFIADCTYFYLINQTRSSDMVLSYFKATIVLSCKLDPLQCFDVLLSIASSLAEEKCYALWYEILQREVR